MKNEKSSEKSNGQSCICHKLPSCPALFQQNTDQIMEGDGKRCRDEDGVPGPAHGRLQADQEHIAKKSPCQNQTAREGKNKKKTYGLKTSRYADSDIDLKEFERLLDELVENTTFKNTKPNKMQAQMKR